MIKSKYLALLSAVIMITSVPVSSYGAWIQNGNCWRYETDQDYVRSAWKLIDGDWYYFDEKGYMTTAWQQIAGKWYFFNPISDGTKGKMLTDWQWIDGKCYFLSPEDKANYPQGAMYENDMTPDGYIVNESGAWINKGGVVEIPKKGIQTVVERKTLSSARTVFSGGSGRDGDGGSRGHKGSNSSKNKNKDEKPDIKPEHAKPTPPDNVEGNEVPKVSDKRSIYTVRYMDIADKTILQIKTGTGKEAETIKLIRPYIDGYALCKGQKDTFVLSGDQITQNVYYEKVTQASPSEARKIHWDLKFIEEGKPDREIFKGQKGKTEEGKELSIDFPETIIGNDHYYYHSMVPSPWSVVVNGNGTQKYYVEFERREKLPAEADPDQKVKEELNHWLEIAKEADLAITGEYSTEAQMITDSQAESNERLLNLASMVADSDRKEVYLITKNHIPTTVILSRKIKNIKNISQLIRAEFVIDGFSYTVMRVGFEKIYEESNSTHSYEVTERVEPTCMNNGYETVRCAKCGKEETMILPATGHTDTDHDGICDICYQPVDETPEAVHYRLGDIQARTIGNRIYLFRCIDEDYEDAMGNSQRTALFLCDSVIRSDIMEESKKLNFGDNNNYKYSKIREWLQDNASDSLFLYNTYVGITKSCLGSTRRGTHEQLNESGLMGYERLYQSMEDKIFILSVEEALKYRNHLWRFNGSDINNPESQISAYSIGYYLRTPQDGGMEDFRYGEGIYVISLTDGNIQPVNVSETSIGMRPVMTIPQG